MTKLLTAEERQAMRDALNSVQPMRDPYDALRRALDDIDAREQQDYALRERQKIGTCTICGLDIRTFDGLIYDERGICHLTCSQMRRIAAAELARAQEPTARASSGKTREWACKTCGTVVISDAEDHTANGFCSVSCRDTFDNFKV